LRLLVGLGNPGPEYEKTRHNAGFLVLDRLKARHAPSETPRGRFNALTVETRIAEEKVMLLKPTTYMNRSGRSVAEAVNFYKLDPASDVLVFVDEAALPIGQIRLRAKGSPGGHNGLADIERHLGTDAYCRCRLGIGSSDVIPQREYVLGKFTEAQRASIEPALDRAADAGEHWVERGIISAMNAYNTRPERKEKKKQDPPADAAQKTETTDRTSESTETTHGNAEGH